MENFEQFVEDVRSQLQPSPRANATAGTLVQLQSYIPEDLSLADLASAWFVLAAPQNEDDVRIAARRKTCEELATIAAQLDPGEGDVSVAIPVWREWRNAFVATGDPRQNAMAETFARELRELQA